MAQAVSIVITVDSSNSQTAIDGVRTKLNELGVVGSASLQKTSAAMDDLGHHTATSLDGVRLLSQEFGLRLPRALEAMISRVPAVTSVISGALSALAGIAIVEVLVRAGEALYNMYEKYLDINKVTQQYVDKLKEAQQLKLLDPGNVADTITNLQQVNDQIDKLNQKASTGGLLGPLLGNHELYTTVDEKQRIGLLSQRDAIQANQKKYEQQGLDEGTEEMRSFAQATQGAVQQLSTLRDLQKDQNLTDFTYGKYGDPSSQGARARLDNDQLKADIEYRAKSIALSREETNAVIAMQNEAVNAGLQGDQKLLAQRQQAVDEITRKYLQGEVTRRAADAETAAVELRFDNERSQRDQQQLQEAQKRLRDASSSGLTGAAKIYADAAARSSDIDAAPNQSDASKAVDHQANNAVALQRLKELQQNFADYTRQIDEERAASGMGASAKIDAAATKQIEDVKKRYQEAFVDKASLDTASVAQYQQMTDALTAIDASAAAQKAQLAQKNAAENAQYDKQASEAERRVRGDGLTGWIADYRDALKEIQDQHAAANLKIDADADLSTTDKAQREVATAREASAQIQALNQNMEHQIASTLQSAFTDPIGTIKSKLEQMFFDILATWILHLKAFQAILGTTGSAGGLGSLGGILGTAGWGHATLPASSGGVGGNDGVFVPPVLHGPDGSVISSSFASSSGGFGGVGGTRTSAGTAGIPGTGGSGTPTFPGGTSTTATALALNPALKGAGIAGVGGYSLYTNTKNAYLGGSPLRGALGDAAAGAAIGSVIPGVGTAIGAVAGGLLGLGAGLAGMITGEGGNLKARDYYRSTLFPAIESERNGMGSVNFQTAVSNVNKIASDGMLYMSQHFGSNAAGWVNANYLLKEQRLADAQIEARARGGSEYVQMQASQFHSGGPIDGFGSYATSSNEGYIHAMMGETVMNTRAASTHGAVLNAMNAGASAGDIAGMYLAASSRPTSAGGSASFRGGDIHVHTLDTKTMEGWLRQGGARLIATHTNNYAGQYAGDGNNG